jgi:hypothetical protein
MKKIVFFFVVSALAQYSYAQMPSDCTVSPVLQHYYERDVKHLALKRIYDLQSPARDSIIIPQIYQDTIWQAMAAVFNLTDFLPRDSVFDFYCIHQELGYYMMNRIYVTISPSCSWYQNWHNLITTTGVPDLDTLLSTYGFTVTGFWTINNTATLTTSQLINVRPVCDSIRTFSGVTYSEPVYPVGFGDEINYSITGPVRFLNFKLGYGDCFSGCIGSLTYQFKVYTDCSVQYLGSVLVPSSYQLPDPSYCYITTNTGEMPRFWTGAISDDWNEVGNWNPAGIPVLDDVRINPGTQHMPVISGNGMSCGNLIIEHGASLTISPGFLLNVHGKLILKN